LTKKTLAVSKDNKDQANSWKNDWTPELEKFWYTQDFFKQNGLRLCLTIIYDCFLKTSERLNIMQAYKLNAKVAQEGILQIQTDLPEGQTLEVILLISSEDLIEQTKGQSSANFQINTQNTTTFIQTTIARVEEDVWNEL